MFKVKTITSFLYFLYLLYIQFFIVTKIKFHLLSPTRSQTILYILSRHFSLKKLQNQSLLFSLSLPYKSKIIVTLSSYFFSFNFLYSFTNHFIPFVETFYLKKSSRIKIVLKIYTFCFLLSQYKMILYTNSYFFVYSILYTKSNFDFEIPLKKRFFCPFFVKVVLSDLFKIFYLCS